MSNLGAMRCAAYARYSSDNQREASINDQLRKCREYAEAHGWNLLPEHVYTDEAISGAGSDRPGLNRLLNTAFSEGKDAFDAVLVDDTSRLSRSLADSIQITQRLKFEGIRLVAVSQGIDSDDEQADVMFTVHGLVDSLYIKELAKKTHRGLEGLALQGYHTGGSCFGYDNQKVGDRVRLTINEVEAKVVRYIFNLFADGLALKAIAKRLNKEGIRPPRNPRNKNLIPSWCVSAIREMLRRELYIGRIIWNRVKYVKRPGTNKRVPRRRPESQWIITDAPELRIVPQELWDRVQEQIVLRKQRFGRDHGFQRRSGTVPYLLSGFLQCGSCGANMTIVAGRGTRDGRKKFYGCPQHFNRGTCTNTAKVEKELLEAAVVQELQERILTAETIDYIVERLAALADAAAKADGDELRTMRKTESELQHQISKLADAVATNGASKALTAAIRERERELAKVQTKIKAMRPGVVANDREVVRSYLMEQVTDMRKALGLGVERARAEMLKRTEGLILTPVAPRNQWSGHPQPITLKLDGIVGFSTQSTPFAGLKLLVEKAPQPLEEEGHKADQPPLVAADTGYFRMVAGGGFEPPTFGL